MINVKFIGMKPWKNHLRKSARKFPKAEREALKRASDRIKRDTERNIQSNFVMRTRALVKGVKSKVWGHGDRTGATIYVRIPPKKKLNQTKKLNMYYGHFLEFGTKYIRPKPFLEKAVMRNQANTFKELGRSFKVL